MVFVSPFWSFFFFNPNNKKPKSANCGGDNGVQLIWFGFFCFFKEKSLIWDVLVQSSGSFSLHTTFLNHSLCFPPFLAYGFFFQNLSLFSPLNPSFFNFYSYLQYWSWSWSHITTMTFLSGSFQYMLSGPSSTKYPCPNLSECFCVFLITWIKYWCDMQL